MVSVVVGMFGWVEIDSNGGFSGDRVSQMVFAAACFFFPTPFEYQDSLLCLHRQP